MLRKNIKKGLRILANPEKCFKELPKVTLEEAMGYYVLMLIAAAVAAGLFNFVFYIAKATYFRTFLNVDVNYARLVNYSIGISTSLIFFYAFAGTFLLFIISIALKAIFKRIKYIELVKILLYSSTPLLLFSWIPYSQIAMSVWSIFLFITGSRLYREMKISKDSTRHRD